MGFQLPSKKNGPISDINVTPFVDVMLVLLIIFMITAPLMFNAIKLELPKTKEVNKVNLTSSQIVLSYAKDQGLFIGEDKVQWNKLISTIENKFGETSNKVLYLRADQGLPYGKVAKLMSYLKSNGISQMALVTEMEDVAPKK